MSEYKLYFTGHSLPWSCNNLFISHYGNFWTVQPASPYLRRG